MQKNYKNYFKKRHSIKELLGVKKKFVNNIHRLKRSEFAKIEKKNILEDS